MTLFDKLYAITDEAAKGLKKPFVRNKVNRGFDGAIDSLESEKVDCQEKIDKLTAEIVNGSVDKIRDLVSARLDLSDLDAMLAEAKKAKEAIFGDYKE